MPDATLPIPDVVQEDQEVDMCDNVQATAGWSDPIMTISRKPELVLTGPKRGIGNPFRWEWEVSKDDRSISTGWAMFKLLAKRRASKALSKDEPIKRHYFHSKGKWEDA